MATTVIISRDAGLREKALHVQGGPVTWVDDCAGLEAALSVPVGRVLVDLNVEWERDLASCIAQCKAHGATSVIAFLHERAGELAIRAHLAGADRVIPQSQLEAELSLLLAPADEASD